MRYMLRIMMLLVLYSASVICFSSLKNAEYYAQELPEYPDADTPQNWEKPDYTTLYKELTPRWFRTVLQSLHLVKQPLWCPQQFSKALHEYVKIINTENFREYIIGTAVSDEHPVELYCFGSIHGSFHSLVRCLRDLQQKDIIDDTFALKKSNVFIVFLGSAINTGPYSLEVLALIFDLQKKNPEHVIYLRGEHEEKQIWYNYSLYQEVQLRSRRMKKNLVQDIQTYFESQPQAVYLVDSAQPQNILCLKADAMTQGDELWEDFLQEFFTELQPQKMDKVYVYDRKRAERALFPRVIVEARNEWDTLAPTQPLKVRYVEKPLVTIFSVASCPSRPFRHMYRLFYDAYVQVSLRGNFVGNVLHVWSRDIRTDDAFEAQGYHLISGKEIASTV